VGLLYRTVVPQVRVERGVELTYRELIMKSGRLTEKEWKSVRDQMASGLKKPVIKINLDQGCRSLFFFLFFFSLSLQFNSNGPLWLGVLVGFSFGLFPEEE